LLLRIAGSRTIIATIQLGFKKMLKDQSQEGDSVCQNREIKEEEAQVLRQRCEDVVRGSWLGVSHFDKERP
jgi:hypothetical protein